MHLRTQLAVIAAKAALATCHLAGRPGSSLPGRVALKINSGILSALASGIRRGIIVTCGTNGKTTTNNLLCSALEAQGFRVVSNRLGANMIEGVTAALATSADLSGHLDADYACLEIDEASAVHILQYLQPNYMLITNLFRDQLDRYGEIDLTMKALENAIRLAPNMTLIINGDDPLTAYLARESGHRVVSYGVSENVTDTSISDDAVGSSDISEVSGASNVSGVSSASNVSSGEVRESRFCENCGAPLHYDFYHFSQLGIYHCPSCGFARPAINYDASDVKLSPQLSLIVRESNALDTTVDLSGNRGIVDDGSSDDRVVSYGGSSNDRRVASGGSSDGHQSNSPQIRISAPMTGFYNVYNILAVYSVLRELRLPTNKLNDVLRTYKPQFGRGEVFHVGKNGGQKVLLNLAKNPAGFNQNIQAMLQDRSPKDLVIVINDNAQDGRDVSWLWDVDFDRLVDPTIRSITVSGKRALDMQLRLKYVEIESVCAPTVEEAIALSLKDGCDNLYVLVLSHLFMRLVHIIGGEIQVLTNFHNSTKRSASRIITVDSQDKERTTLFQKIICFTHTKNSFVKLNLSIDVDILP